MSYVVGAGLILWSSGIHFHLWLDLGYRNIPGIDVLFAIQAFAGLVVSIVIATRPRVWAGLVGIVFAFATMTGFFISVTHGLLGFRESWSAPDAVLAFVVEAAAVLTLSLAVILSLHRTHDPTGATEHDRIFQY